MWHRTRPLLRLLVVPFLLAAVLPPLAAPQRAQAQSVDDGLVGDRAFDEGAGSTSADGSGNGNTATLHTPNSFTGSTAPIDFANPFALAASNSASSYATRGATISIRSSRLQLPSGRVSMPARPIRTQIS